MKKLTRIRPGRVWQTDFTAQDVKDMFEAEGPYRSVIGGSHYSLAWFVETVFRNKAGRPLRLQPFQSIILNMFWNKKFPLCIASRGSGKTFLLALYIFLKCLLCPGTKVVIVGAGFRQAKLVFAYIDELYESSPIVQEATKLWGGPKYGSDAARFRIGTSTVTAIPIGDGDKVRGLRATVLVCDEFGSIPEETFNVVLKPFAAVHADPSQRAETSAFCERLLRLGASKGLVEKIESHQGFGNQVIISGTGTDRQNHFYKKFVTYKAFIKSKGDIGSLKQYIAESYVNYAGKPPQLSEDEIEIMAKNWHQYAIIQLPYTAIPKNFLDMDVITQDKAEFPPDVFAKEYLAMFPQDTDGFFKRSWIEAATPRDDIGGVEAPESVVVELYGDPRFVYVLGLDPARQNDNFGAVVLKLTDRGNELVYCTSWTKSDWEYSARKIFEICRRFSIQYIAMDAGGGGWSVMDWLHKNIGDVQDHEFLWPIREQIKDPSMLGAPGRKIVDLINFNTWAPPECHQLQATICRGYLLFPYKGDDKAAFNQYISHFEVNPSECTKEQLDRITESLFRDMWGIDSWEVDKLKKDRGIILESQKGVMEEIHECVNETCNIVRVTTEGGTEKFILPPMKDQPEGIDMRRRDRFSALLLANYAARVQRGHGHKSPIRPGITTSQNRTSTKLTGGSVRRRGRVAY